MKSTPLPDILGTECGPSVPLVGGGGGFDIPVAQSSPSYPEGHVQIGASLVMSH